jgi:YbbR domain-containing protein
MPGLTEHLGWKVLSLVAAIALWYLVIGDTEVGVSMPIIVQYRNLPADMEITGDHLDRLFIKVRGPRPRVSTEALERTSLMLDLTGVNTPGERTVRVTAQELGLPAGVELLRVIPAQIRLRFDRRVTKSVEVQARITGAPPRGYRITQQRISPEFVRITGPESNLRTVTSVMTDPINLDSSVGYAEFRVPVALDDPQLRVEESQPVSVGITLEKTP